MLVVLGWMAAAVMVALALTQLAGWTRTRYVAALQALTPYVFALAVPIGIVAAVFGQWAMAAVFGAVAVLLAVLCRPLLRRQQQATAAPGATPLRLFHANLLYKNEDGATIAAVLERLDVDILAVSEYTPIHAAAMKAGPLVERYPYRIEHPDPDADGTALWSRYPLTDRHDTPPSRSQSVLVTVGSPQPLLLFLVHTHSPIVSMWHWRRELDHLADESVVSPRSDAPTLVVGDMNTSYWHPKFRDLLRHGWRDAHQLVGRGFATTWPDDLKRFPRYVGIDHALVNPKLVVTGLEDVSVPGSDHLGFIVTVAAAN